MKEKQEAAPQQAGSRDCVKKLSPQKGKPRLSTSGSYARVRKVSDRGFRPSMIVQFGVDTRSRAVVRAEVSQAGSDKGLSEGMRDQVEQRTGSKV